MTGEASTGRAGLSPVRHAMAAAAVFGLGWVIVDDGLGASLRAHFSPVEVVWWRYGAHLALMVMVWGPRNLRRLVCSQRPLLQLVRSTMMIVMPGSFVLALSAGASPDFIWSVFWLCAILIVAASRSMGERPPAAYTLLAVAGTAVVMLIHGDAAAPGSPTGIACAGAMTLSFVTYIAMTRMLRDETVESNLFYTALGPFVALSFAMPRVWVAPDAADALVLTCIGVVGFVALYGLDRACHSAPAWAGAPGLLTQPLLAVGSGAALAAHVPGVRACVGVALLCLILGAAWKLAGCAWPAQTEAVP